MDALDDDLAAHIVPYLAARDILRLALTCKRFGGKREGHPDERGGEEGACVDEPPREGERVEEPSISSGEGIKGGGGRSLMEEAARRALAENFTEGQRQVAEEEAGTDAGGDIGDEKEKEKRPWIDRLRAARYDDYVRKNRPELEDVRMEDAWFLFMGAPVLTKNGLRFRPTMSDLF